VEKKSGGPADIKVNTPLKSHQSKIESLTVDYFTFGQTTATTPLRSVCAHAVCKQGWKYDAGIPADSGHGYGGGSGGSGDGGSRGGDSAGAQVGGVGGRGGRAYKANFDRY